MTPALDVHVIGARVDWLTLAFRVKLTPEALDALRAAAEEAERSRTGQAPVRIGAREWNLRPIHAHAWRLTDDDARVEVHERAPGAVVAADGVELPGWTVAVACSGLAFLARTHEDNVKRAWESAAVFGAVREARLRRVDLAADVTGFALDVKDWDSWVMRSRVGSTAMMQRATAFEVKELRDPRDPTRVLRERVTHCFTPGDDVEIAPAPGGFGSDGAWEAVSKIGGRFTGWRFGRGEALVRIYDKLYELETVSRDKLAHEKAWWTANGWNQEAEIRRGAGRGVVRVEVQAQGAVLDELRTEDGRTGRCSTLDVEGDAALFAERVTRLLDPLWHYFTGGTETRITHTRRGDETETVPFGWLRLVDLATHKKRSRASARASWTTLQSVVFARRAPVLGRVRKRSAARSAQAFGCAIGALACRGELGDVRAVDGERATADGELVPNLLDERATAAHVGAAGARAALDRLAGEVFGRLRVVFVRDAIELADDDEVEALARALVKCGATRARFASQDDPPPPRIALTG